MRKQNCSIRKQTYKQDESERYWGVKHDGEMCSVSQAGHFCQSSVFFFLWPSASYSKFHNSYIHPPAVSTITVMRHYHIFLMSTLGCLRMVHYNMVFTVRPWWTNSQYTTKKVQRKDQHSLGHAHDLLHLPGSSRQQVLPKQRLLSGLTGVVTVIASNSCGMTLEN